MPTEIKGTSADEIRMRSYRQQLETHHDMEVRELERRHGEDLARLQDLGAAQLQDLKRAYDVRISEEAERLEEQLINHRAQAAERLEEEKRNTDAQVEKTRTANQQRIDEYKRNGEAQLDKLRKEYQSSAEDLHEKSLRSARRADRMSSATTPKKET